MNYAEAAARRKGWTSLTEEQWAALDAERSAAPEEPQGDLFDAEVAMTPETPSQPRTRGLRGKAR